MILNVNGEDVPTALLPSGRVVCHRGACHKACRLLSIKQNLESHGGARLPPGSLAGAADPRLPADPRLAAAAAADAADPNGAYAVSRFDSRYGARLDQSRCVALLDLDENIHVDCVEVFDFLAVLSAVEVGPGR